jgi:putative tricarboxylic transport membrane protein
MRVHGTVRRLLLAAAVFGGGAALPAVAQPLDNLKIMAPAAPGGGYDRTSRAMQEALEKAGLAKSVTVTNVPGAAGAIGLAQFIRTDKGTPNSMMVGGFGMVASFLTNKSAVTLKDVTPIARLTGEFSLVVVPAASDIKSVKDLVAKFKADPGAVSWAGGSAGGTDHIVAGLIAKAAGVDAKKVNYIAFSGGGDSLAALVGNQVTAGIGGYSELIGQVNAGKLRALAITAEKPVEGVKIPTLNEQGIDVALVNWRGVTAPPGLSDAQRKAYLDLVDKMVKSDGWKAQLAANNWTDLYLAGDAFAKFIAAENQRVGEVLNDLGLIK